MIKSVKLTNFFSFKEEEIELDSQVNLLVGINGSGKSNFLKAFQLLKTGVEGNQEDNALFKLLVEQWGGFENIFCSSETKGDYDNSIGLEFCFDGREVSKFGAFDFREDLIYKIVIIRQSSTNGFHVSEKISSKDGGYIYLDFIHGAGRLSERTQRENGSNTSNREWSVQLVAYEGYNPQELVFSKISALDKEKYLPLTVIKEAIKSIVVYNYFDTTLDSKMRRAVSAATTVRYLLPDGSNLPQLLSRLKLMHKSEQKKYLTQMNFCKASRKVRPKVPTQS